MLSSWSGPTASLLGTGVNEDPVVVPLDFARPLEGTGVDTVGRDGKGAAGEEEEGVLWKKPKRVCCPPEDEDFFNAGVEAGVDEAFLAMTGEGIPTHQ